MKSLTAYITPPIVNTIEAIVILLALHYIFTFICTRQIKDRNTGIKYVKRIDYVLFFIMIFVVGKIWLAGFTYLFTILGLIGAALILTQRPTIMNISGWLVIIWREIFLEGDYIEINKQAGVVDKIGMFHFNLLVSERIKVNNDYYIDAEVKTIKIPNSMVMTHPLINYSRSSHLIKQEIVFYIKNSSAAAKAKEQATNFAIAALQTTYHDNPRYRADLKKLTYADNECLVYITSTANYKKPKGIKLSIAFWCYHEHAEEIKTQIEEQILQQFTNSKEIELLI